MAEIGVELDGREEVREGERRGEREGPLILCFARAELK